MRASPTMDNHVTTLKGVMNAILESGLAVNPSTCGFGNGEVDFWSMDNEGVRPDQAVSTSIGLHHHTKIQKSADKLFMHDAIKGRLYSKVC